MDIHNSAMDIHNWILYIHNYSWVSICAKQLSWSRKASGPKRKLYLPVPLRQVALGDYNSVLLCGEKKEGGKGRYQVTVDCECRCFD